MIKYILIWMVSFGFALGAADEKGIEAISENLLASMVMAPVVASKVVAERAFND